MFDTKAIKSHLRSTVGSICILITTTTAIGCAAAAVGAGAAGGIAYSDRGAKGDMKGKVTSVNQKAETALREMGIKITGNESKNSGGEKDLTGNAHHQRYLF